MFGRFNSFGAAKPKKKRSSRGSAASESPSAREVAPEPEPEPPTPIRPAVWRPRVPPITTKPKPDAPDPKDLPVTHVPRKVGTALDRMQRRLNSIQHTIDEALASERYQVIAPLQAVAARLENQLQALEDAEEAEPITLSDLDSEVITAEREVARIGKDMAAARRASNHPAVASMGLQLTAAQKRLVDARNAAKAGMQARNLTEADLRDKLRLAAEAMPEPHLVVFAEEWLRRHRLRAVPKGGTDEN